MLYTFFMSVTFIINLYMHVKAFFFFLQGANLTYQHIPVMLKIP